MSTESEPKCPEEKLMKAISNNSLEEVETILRTEGSSLRVNWSDENGMTPLDNACYKGNYGVCKLLIERGADVNSKKHIHGYTSLMFASLGGHLKIVSLLLENGANVTGVNSVGRTAAQMAAFVGQHAAVSIINNFVARDEVEYYSKRQGLEKEPKITPVLVDPILSLARQINIHPVKIAMIITESKVLYENLSKVAKVLELMCDREMKKEDPNEQLALKYHLLSFVTKQIKKFDEGIKSKDDDIQKRFEPLLKSWMKGRDEDGFPVTLEKLLRQSIREFGYRDCTIFLQLVKTLSSVEIGSEPSAVSILVQAMTGKKGSAMDDEVNVCSTCGEPNPPKKCSQCKTVPYCDVRCQKLHWFTHKNFCIKLKHNHELSEKLAKSAQITASDDNE